MRLGCGSTRWICGGKMNSSRRWRRRERVCVPGTAGRDARDARDARRRGGAPRAAFPAVPRRCQLVILSEWRGRDLATLQGTPTSERKATLDVASNNDIVHCVQSADWGHIQSAQSTLARGPRVSGRRVCPLGSPAGNDIRCARLGILDSEIGPPGAAVRAVGGRRGPRARRAGPGGRGRSDRNAGWCAAAGTGRRLRPASPSRRRCPASSRAGEGEREESGECV